MKKTKITALLLAVLMLISLLAGCKNSTDGDTPDGTGDGENTAPEYVYAASFKALDSSTMDYIQRCFWNNGKFYLYGRYKTGEKDSYTYTDENGNEVKEEYDITEYGLFTMDLNGTGFELLPNFSTTEIPEGVEGDSYINCMTVSPDGSIWTIENVYTYTFDLPEDFDEETGDKWEYYTGGDDKYILRKLDGTGAEAVSIDLSEALATDDENSYVYVYNMEIDSEGNVYLVLDQRIVVLDGEGNKIFEVTTDNWVNSTVRLADGSVAFNVYEYSEVDETGGYVLKFIDPETKDWKEESVKLPNGAYNLYTGSGDYDLYYVSSNNFYGYDIETEESEKLFNFINCDVDSSYLSAIVPMEDGSVVAISSTWDSSYSSRTNELVTIQLVDASTIPQKTTLTYACMYLDYNIRREIINFNKKNDLYRIEVSDYSEYNTEDDYTAGLTKLTTEILSGKVPDIISTGSMPIDRFAAKDLLEDLWPWIEQDAEFGGRDAFVQPVFNALCSDDGKLFQITPSFTVYTVMGPTWLVGSEMGWTIDDLYEAYAQMPEGADIFYLGMTKSDALTQCIYMSLDGLVNWETGECNFDSEEFINILKFVDMFPEEFDWDAYYDGGYEYESEYSRFMSGKQMLEQMYLYDFDDYQYYKEMLGGEVTFIGYPTGSGNGSAFSVETGLAMSSTCKDKEGAWQFIRTFLTEDYQKNVYNFPTNKNVFDALLEEAMTPEYGIDPETGEQVEESKGVWYLDNENYVELGAITQEEADQILDLINATDRIYTYDDTLYEVISSECGAFFAGQKSAEETAKLVQSRVNIYVNEQR